MRQITHQGQLGHAIRLIRREQGITQAELAARAGVSAPWLSAVENGKPGAEIGLVFKVLGALGQSLTVVAAPADPLEFVAPSGGDSHAG